MNSVIGVSNFSKLAIRTLLILLLWAESVAMVVPEPMGQTIGAATRYHAQAVSVGSGGRAGINRGKGIHQIILIDCSDDTCG